MIVDVFLLFVIIFVVYQLYSVLGQSPSGTTTQSKTRQDKKPPIITTTSQIRQHIPLFNEESFLAGATNAFEHIVKAFVTGDIDALAPLLEKDLFLRYKKDFEERIARNHTYSLTFFRHITTNIKNVSVQKKHVLLTVYFKSEQSLSLYKGKTLVEGDPERTEILEDCWVFSHPCRSSDSLWRLCSTTAHE